MKLLVQALYDSSTNNYPRYFPNPLNLIMLANDNDVLLDFNLEAYKKNKEEKEEIVIRAAKIINESYLKYEEIIINCGEYAPDGAFYDYFESLLDKIKVKVSIVGSYPSVFPDRISKKYPERIKIKEFDFNVNEAVLDTDLLKLYPEVDGLKKVNVKISNGCLRKCNFCPVHLIHKGKYTYFDIEQSLNLIKYYYNKGIRFFNFIDDNIGVSSKFIDFLRRLKEENLKGAKFQVQEGFEVLIFKNKEICILLKENNFVDIKIGVENINEEVRKSLNKTFFSSNDLEIAMKNIQETNLDAKMFLLISSSQTSSEIMENVKYVLNYNLSARINILRAYENSKYFTEEKQSIINDSELKEMKSLALALIWLNKEKKINVFNDRALQKLQLSMNLQITENNEEIIVIGNCNFGFKTPYFVKALKYLLEMKKNCKLKTLQIEKEKIIYSKIKNEITQKVA